MADEARKRPGYGSLDAINPYDGTQWEVWISHQRMDVVAKQGMGHAKELAFVVPAVLAKPTAVFEGLTSDKDEDRHGVGWLCYVGTPDRSYRRDGSQAPPWEGEVFLVFVNEERVAYQWGWEECDPADPDLPIDHQARFKQRVL